MNHLLDYHAANKEQKNPRGVWYRLIDLLYAYTAIFQYDGVSVFNSEPQVYFFVPTDRFSDDNEIDALIREPDPAAAWRLRYTPAGTHMGGHYAWTIQTYLNLRTRGVPCCLSRRLPQEGIVLSHERFLRQVGKPSSRLLLVCLRADQGRIRYAQLHVVQNPAQVRLPSWYQLWESHFIPYWPQPGLVPRNPSRGNRFEVAAYLGAEKNLAPALHDAHWAADLQKRGIEWRPAFTDNAWSDYSNIDAVVAVRRFQSLHIYDSKPATKLFNAWRAGVPAILGPESGYRAERKTSLDYIEVTSYQDLIAAIDRLRADSGLRKAMVENGFRRSTEVSTDAITERWRQFLTAVAIPAYVVWQRQSSIRREALFLARTVHEKAQQLFLGKGGRPP